MEFGWLLFTFLPCISAKEKAEADFKTCVSGFCLPKEYKYVIMINICYTLYL